MIVDTSTNIPTAMAIPYPNPTLLKLTCILVLLLELILSSLSQLLSHPKLLTLSFTTTTTKISVS
jgi:hypothetical protein